MRLKITVKKQHLVYWFKQASDRKFWKFFPHEIKKIILCKSRFNSCKVELNIRKLIKTQTSIFPDAFFNLTSHGLNLTLCKLNISSQINCPTSHWSETLHSLILYNLFLPFIFAFTNHYCTFAERAIKELQPSQCHISFTSGQIQETPKAGHQARPHSSAKSTRRNENRTPI